MNISKDVCKKKKFGKKNMSNTGVVLFFLWCSVHTGALASTEMTMGVRAHSPGGLREAQGGWRRRPREAGGGGTGGRLRGGGRLKRGEAQGAGSLHRSDNRPILIAR